MVNLPPVMWDEIAELCSAVHLKMGPCARMLLAEALSMRALYPKIRVPPKKGSPPGSETTPHPPVARDRKRRPPPSH